MVLKSRQTLKLALLFSLALGLPATTLAQNSQAKTLKKGVHWTRYDEALKQFKNKDAKPVMIQFYANWCKYCKQMDKESFTQPDIYNLLNKAFVSVRLTDGDKTTYTLGKDSFTANELFAEYQVLGPPAFVFFSKSGQPLTKIPGYMPPDRFGAILKFIASKAYENMSFEDYLKKEKITLKDE